MEIDEALAFCLRRLQAEPERLLRLALSIAAPVGGEPGAVPLPPRAEPGEGKANRTVLQASQDVLAETLARLDQDHS
ncbi:hypothetical protein QMO56_15990 [Roseomonas sp. E05]|uniref:hypothetical protein n=1 Tax=Roseomonas sp. E05 TaxID=3046310 RepID=UPI0024B9D3E0|nr:hypothetical protein [Roseomonas sp. E05]MDJ0389617.1 hypothetical protein [Roseomonas sp. E05]